MGGIIGGERDFLARRLEEGMPAGEGERRLFLLCRVAVAGLAEREGVEPK